MEYPKGLAGALRLLFVMVCLNLFCRVKVAPSYSMNHCDAKSDCLEMIPEHAVQGVRTLVQYKSPAIVATKAASFPEVHK